MKIVFEAQKIKGRKINRKQTVNSLTSLYLKTKRFDIPFITYFPLRWYYEGLYKHLRTN